MTCLTDCSVPPLQKKKACTTFLNQFFFPEYPIFILTSSPPWFRYDMNLKSRAALVWLVTTSALADQTKAARLQRSLLFLDSSDDLGLTVDTFFRLSSHNRICAVLHYYVKTSCLVESRQCKPFALCNTSNVTHSLLHRRSTRMDICRKIWCALYTRWPIQMNFT